MSDHDWLQKRLEGEAYVPDAGFTDRVLAAMPAVRPRLSARARIAVLAGCAVVATLLAIFVLGAGGFVGHSLQELVAFRGTHGATLPIAGLGLVLLIAGGAAAAMTET